MANYGRKTPAPGHGDPIRITAADLSHACDFVRNSPGVSKWTKPQIMSAADGMAWLLRELPGSPGLLAKLMDLLHGHPDPVIAIGDVANLVRAQTLDCNILEEEDVPPLLMPGGGGAAAAAAATAGAGHVGVGSATAAAAAAATLAISATTVPATAAAVVGELAQQGGDAAAAAAAAAGAAAAAPAAAAVAVGAPAAGAGAAAAAAAAAAHPRKPPKTTVCAYLWRRMLCRKANCEYLHPDLCADRACMPIRNPDCGKFHGRFKEDKEEKGKKSVKTNKSKSSTTAKKDPNRTNQGNGRRGAPPPNSSSGPRSNNRRFPPSTANRRSSKQELEETRRRELEGLKRDIASLKRFGMGAPSRHLTPPTMGDSYSDVVRSSARAQHRGSSFAQAFATALEAALGNAGLTLASTC